MIQSSSNELIFNESSTPKSENENVKALHYHFAAFPTVLWVLVYSALSVMISTVDSLEKASRCESQCLQYNPVGQEKMECVALLKYFKIVLYLKSSSPIHPINLQIVKRGTAKNPNPAL